MKTGQKKQDVQTPLVLPDNFEKKLSEIIDPQQSIDYQIIDGIYLPIRVLPLGMENKFHRITACLDYETNSNYEWVISRGCGEIIHFYEPSLPLDWIEKHSSKEEMESYFNAHLDKLEYNDDITLVVHKVIQQIKWHPLDEKREKERKKYSASDVFHIPLFLLNVSEAYNVFDFSNRITRGFLEIMKLNNMISNDRFHFTPKEEGKSSDTEQPRNDSLENYLADMDKQGVDLRNLF